MLRRLVPEQVPLLRRDAVDPDTQQAAARIVDDVRLRGEVALREHAARLGDWTDGPLVLDRADLAAAARAIAPADLALLERTAGRIRAFAEAQRAAHGPVEVDIPGGRAGL